MITVDIKKKDLSGTQILGEISFTLSAGEILAISGPSGVGKTTLLQILAGLDPSFQGSILGAQRIAMVFQEPVLLPWRSVLANIMLVTGVDENTASTALNDVGLGHLGQQFPDQLSLGQQRRLAFARALSAAPDLLLLDEPFVSLDPELVEEMLTLTERLLAGRQIATVLVTHTPAEAKRLATRMGRLQGRPARLETMPPATSG